MNRNWTQCSAPHHYTFLIALVLYIVALLAHFNVIHVSGEVALWSWVIGFGLLLISVRVKGL